MRYVANLSDISIVIVGKVILQHTSNVYIDLLKLIYP
jgi:hypothetical protein